LNSIVAALHGTKRDTGLNLDALNEFSNYWELVREFYAPFDTSPKSGSANVYLHEMPGGQYTNLKEQAASMGLLARWPEIERMYADVNQLFGDIVKVTPSSKVVGDMTMFMITRGLKPADVLELEPGSAPFPESVIDMLQGGLGQPMGGWPKKLQKVVLGNRRPYTVRPGARLEPLNLEKIRVDLTHKLKREATEDDVYSYLMYPEVFNGYAKIEHNYGDLSVLPTPAFFYGMKPGDEITVDLEAGKTLFIRLMNISPVDPEGKRVVSFELNGVARQTTVVDKSVQPKVKSRPKADPNDPLQVGAPIPGVITALPISIGSRVTKGERLLSLEAMKMQTTVYAPADGVVAEIAIKVGDTVEAKDLLVKLKA
jgi:pyruvate carboxylase